MTGWELPETIEISGVEYEINSDYRDVLDIISRLTDESLDEQTRIYVSLSLFYKEFIGIPEKDYKQAIQCLFDFISCGEGEDKQERPKTIDWEQDISMIVSDVNKVAGCEIRSLPFCHWWTFIAWFNGIGEGQLSVVVSIREKLRNGKKLSDWEAKFYRANRTKVDFNRKYTTTENEVLGQWIGI